MSSKAPSKTAQLEKEIKRLQQENAAYRKMLNSKRFRYAERIANGYNQLFPPATLRGRFTHYLISKLADRRKKLSRKRARTLESAIADYENIIVLHSIPWNTPLKQRPHHLARCFADQGFFVIFLEPEESVSDFRRITKNIYTCNSEIDIFAMKLKPKKHYYFFFNNVSNLTLAQVKAFKERGYELVYEYIDEFHEDIAGPLANQLQIWDNLKELSPRLVLASATKLYLDAKRHLGSEKHLLLSKNAVNVADFDYHQFLASRPTTIAKLINSDKPIVGYYGAIAPWLDYKLIHSSAKAHPEYDFVYIGVNYGDALERLDQSIPNLHYLGPRDYKDLPALAAQFSCAIIPFSTGEIAKGTSPVKLFEYMAAGLPSVVTRDLDECKGYDYVHVARDAKDFAKLLPRAISELQNEACRERLLAQAEDNSWARRVEDIIKALHTS